MRFTAEAGSALPLIVAALVGAAVLAFLLTPAVRLAARRLRIVDRPNARRVNTRPIPRGGGLAVAAAFVPVALALLALNGSDGHQVVSQPRTIGSSELVALLLGGLLAMLLGLLDDVFQLRARWQLIGQLALAAFAVVLGIEITVLNNPVGPGLIHLNGLFAVGFTVLWIAGMINSINFIDGLDGLSSGIAFIAAITLGVISLTDAIGQPFVALFCFTLAGALLGFLRWNFHPASIFVGTSGVMFVGYTLAVLSILGTAKVAVALLVLGVPIIDTFWIIVRRLAAGKSPFTPDRGHIHHRLLDLGISHRQTVLLIYVICAGLAVLSLALSGRAQVYAFLGIVVASGLVLLALTQRSLVDEQLMPEPYEEYPPLTRAEVDAAAGSPTVARREQAAGESGEGIGPAVGLGRAAQRGRPADAAPDPAGALPPRSGGVVRRG